ncbi:MAG: transporter substrate-binding domain-containing protein [Clostridia bacterium]|nr:transporter substrate-binding domain-containing protein [Clostridia bacterium]
MKRTLSLILAAVMILTAALLASCSGNSAASDISGAKNLADLAGTKIAAQAGTFHADAVKQIKDVKSSTYPEFSDLLTALKSGAIDGYVAEEPTALAVCLGNESLGYLKLVNNSTGFTATDADTGIAVGLKKGSALKDQINAVLAEITTEQRAELMELMVKLSNGQEIGELPLKSETPANPEKTLKVAMECAYEPFNWTDLNTPTAGAVEIYDQNGNVRANSYANGYDIQIAKYVANKLGMKLEVYAIEWDSLLPAVQAGTVDAIIAGMSPTEERAKEIDFTNVYYSSNLVIIYKK